MNNNMIYNKIKFKITLHKIMINYINYNKIIFKINLNNNNTTNLSIRLNNKIFIDNNTILINQTNIILMKTIIVV